MGAIEEVRAWAKGMYALEAGVELLIRTGRIYDGAPWVKEGGVVDLDELLDASGVWSGGQQRITRIAASLMGEGTVDLSADIPGLDREFTQLVLAAIAHANGSHEHSGIEIQDGRRRIVNLETLHPWPEASPS